MRELDKGREVEQMTRNQSASVLCKVVWRQRKAPLIEVAMSYTKHGLPGHVTRNACHDSGASSDVNNWFYVEYCIVRYLLELS